MLVGREEEQARIEGLLARGRAGTSGVLLIRGEPGIGKSALLEHAAAAAADALVMRARGIDSELELAWAGLHELLRPVLATVERLPGPQADALRGALGLAAGPAAERHLVGAATLGVLYTIGAEPGRALLAAEDPAAGGLGVAPFAHVALGGAGAPASSDGVSGPSAAS